MQAGLFAELDDGPVGLRLGGSLGLAEDDLLYVRDFISKAAADAFFDVLLRDTPWTQERIRIYGEEHDLPRLTAWFGDPGASYTYSGIRQEPHPWTPTLLAIRQLVEAFSAHRFNSVLLNLYRTGSDRVGWHADDEPEFGDRPVIASVSLGASRRFKVRQKSDPKKAIGLDLEHGSLLLMRGDLQRLCEHEVPRTAKVVGQRINLTFRYVA